MGNVDGGGDSVVGVVDARGNRVEPDALAARLAEADRGDAPAAPGAAPLVQSPPLVDLIAEARDAVFYFGGMVREALPARISAHWTDRRLERLGVALGRCAQRYEWVGKLLTGVSHPVGELVVALADLGRPIAEPYVMALFKKPEHELPVARQAEEPAPVARPKPQGVAPLEDEPR